MRRHKRWNLEYAEPIQAVTDTRVAVHKGKYRGQASVNPNYAAGG